MSTIIFNNDKLKKLVIGGTILGGGGGGSRSKGEKNGKIALDYNEVKLIDIDDVPEDSLIITVSGVGAPASKNNYVMPEDYVETIRLFQKITGKEIKGIITNENGGSASINGFIQSAVLDIPLIDAPANGRAHPTGTMGGLGLNKIDNFISEQVSIGGNPDLNNHIKCYFKGNIKDVSSMVRESAVKAGGSVAVCRNPVQASYIKQNAAVGGLSHALELGEKFYEGLEKSPTDAILNAVDFLKGEIITKGFVKNFSLVTRGGFDVGSLSIDGYELTFWNEYMTIEKDNIRLATFPDLIMTFDIKTGMPITTAELKEDMNVCLIKTNMNNIKLGSTMYDKELLKEIEEVISKSIVNELNI